MDFSNLAYETLVLLTDLFSVSGCFFTDDMAGMHSGNSPEFHHASYLH